MRGGRSRISLRSIRATGCAVCRRVGKAKRAHHLCREKTQVARGHGAFRAFAHPTSLQSLTHPYFFSALFHVPPPPPLAVPIGPTQPAHTGGNSALATRHGNPRRGPYVRE